MVNAREAVKEGGVVIILGECRDGSGSKTYEEIMKKFKTPEKVEHETRKNFQVGAHKAYGVTSLMVNVEFILVSELDNKLSELLLFTPADNLNKALEIAYEKLDDNPSIITMPQGSYTAPNSKIKENRICNCSYLA